MRVIILSLAHLAQNEMTSGWSGLHTDDLTFFLLHRAVETMNIF